MKQRIIEYVTRQSDKLLDHAEECNWPFLWINVVVATIVAFSGILMIKS